MKELGLVVLAKLLLILHQLHYSEQSNWAQSSGDFAQNVVFPYIPSPANRHWQGRFGHATVVAYNPNADKDKADLGKVYLVGGDTNYGDKTSKPFTMGKLDQVWNNGYKNDVWRMGGTDWLIRGDNRVRTAYRQKVPKVTSKIKWEQVSPGLVPPVGVSYDDWIICQPYFGSGNEYRAKRAQLCKEGTNTVQWSPRRHHALVYFKGSDGKWAMYLMGGRAREYVELPEERSIGGVLQQLQPRVKEAENVAMSRVTTKREAIVLKSDVWKSFDGESWELVTPGCQAPQEELLNEGNPNNQGYGHKSKQCKTNADCYGAESCHPQKQTCFCTMWTSREQHTVAAYGSRMYLMGGYASYLYFKTSECGNFGCGDTDASAYRYYLSDVWTSSDGLSWSSLTQDAFKYTSGGKSESFPRGGHSMIVFNPPPSYPLAFASQCSKIAGTNDMCRLGANPGDLPELWIFGGRGGENELHNLASAKPFNDSTYYYNDIWVSRAQDSSGTNLGSTWYRVRKNTEEDLDNPNWWAGRTGHTVTLSCTWPRTDCLIKLPPGVTGSLQQRFVYVVGGQGLEPLEAPIAEFGEEQQPRPVGGKGFFFDDTWSWRPDMPDETFKADFTPGALFGTGDGSTFRYTNNSPALQYISPDSPISTLIRLVPPTKLEKNDNKRLEVRPYLSSIELKQLNDNGITTIRDLTDPDLADKYVILRLRGFDFPQVPLEKRLDFLKICDVRALALAVVEKCSVQVSTETLYDGQRNQPKNVIPEWGGGMPGITVNGISWHGKTRSDYKKLFPSGEGTDDPVTLKKEWDGCTATPAIDNPIHGTDVDGLGYVEQITSIRNPLPELQELKCKWTPGLRAYHSAVFYEDRMYIFGGKSVSYASPVFEADTWYRDAVMPTTRFKSKPETRTDNPFFWFALNEPGVIYEYRLWDPINYKEVRPWTKCTVKTDIGWLSWRKGGPGNGLYSLYVRSIDPAGNSDERYVYAQNVYTWYYVSPTPWDIIFEAAGSFFMLGLFGYLEYRRRVRKAAMERYAMKRMRRKFKAMQRDIDGRATDWRTLYMESKAAEEALKGKKKAKKAVRDKKKEKRDKDKKKRDKEKEMMKKKLKAEAGKKSKDAKAKGGTSIADSNQDKGEDEKMSKKKSSKEKDKEKKKMKDKDEGGGGASSKKDEKKKLKDYEKGSEADTPAKVDPLEEGVKQRKSNKRFKEYEAEGGGGEAKKDA